MSQVIGRVVTGVHETLRGPDVVHRVAVRREWIEEGESVELSLPRNLSCASCEGGGCDRCGRSGAITLRSRAETPVTVRLTLPRRSAEELREQPSFVLRVPDAGGAASSRPDLPRGLLLLRIVTAAASDPGVRLAAAEPSVKTERERAPSAAPISSVRPKSRQRSSLVALAVAVVVLCIVLGLALAGGFTPGGFSPFSSR